MTGVRIGAACAVAGVVALAGGGNAQAGTQSSIDVTATAQCDGTVTADYSWELPANQTLEVEVVFTAGALTVTEPGSDVAASPDVQAISGSVTVTGFSPGDVVVVDVFGFVLPAELEPVGVTTVEVPECPPPVTDPPATDPPATEPPATEPPATEPPVTEPPAETEPPQVPVPVSTLPSTGDGPLPRGAVAATMLLLGVGLVVLATRRRPDDQGFGTSR